MIVFYLFLLLALVIFFFSLYVIGREDLTFIRKNISLEQLFNIAFLTIAFGLFSARLFYVLFNPSSSYLNLLVFFLVPYFPGLSLIGGILGGTLFVITYAGIKKLPRGRIIDFFSLALLASVPIGYLGTFFSSESFNPFISIYLPLIYFVLFILSILILFRRLIRGEIKNGSLGTFLLMTFAFINLVIGLSQNGSEIFYFLSIEDIISLAIVLSAIFLFLREEMFITRSKK